MSSAVDSCRSNRLRYPTAHLHGLVFVTKLTAEFNVMVSATGRMYLQAANLCKKLFYEDVVVFGMTGRI